MKYANVFDDIDSDGQPIVATGHRRLEPELARRIVGYLRSATLVSRTADVKEDLLDSSRRIPFASSVRTDGDWYWCEELAWYVEHYQLAPTKGFLEHLRRASFIPAKPTKDQLEELLIQLRLAPVQLEPE